MKIPESSSYFCITGLEVKMTNEFVFDNIRTGFPLQVQIVENSETTDKRQGLTTFEKRVKKNESELES